MHAMIYNKEDMFLFNDNINNIPPESTPSGGRENMNNISSWCKSTLFLLFSQIVGDVCQHLFTQSVKGLDGTAGRYVHATHVRVGE